MKPHRARYLLIAGLATLACWLGAPRSIMHHGTSTASAASAGDTQQLNKQVVLRFNQALNDHDLTELDAIVAVNVVDHTGNPGAAPGLAGVKQGLQGFLDAFPDLQLTTVQLVAENDLVADYSTATGTNTGSLFGMPPTGRVVTSSGMDMYRIQNGTITEIWHLDDAAAQLARPAGGPGAGQ